MRHPWANIALLVLLLLQVITGAFGFVNGMEDRRWLLWLHGIGAYAISFILLWKGAIVVDVYRRNTRWTWVRLGFAGMAFLLVLTLILGLMWTFVGPNYLFGFSLVTLHIFLAVGLILLIVWHIWRLRWILRTPRAFGRRTFIRTSGAGLAGLAIWLGANGAKSLWSLPGAIRRFTGSYETGSFTGVFPRVSWIADRPPNIDVGKWRLLIDGAVKNRTELDFDQLSQLSGRELTAVLDCTGGWYTEQLWRGVSVRQLLELSGLEDDARSVTFEAISGYKRRFGLDEARGFLLALEVAGKPLTHGHGFPLRLVAPGQRGLNWVKWLVRLRVNRSGKNWQLPLPLQ